MTSPDAYRHPRLGVLYIGSAARLCAWTTHQPLFCTTNRADELINESTPLWFTEQATS